MGVNFNSNWSPFVNDETTRSKRTARSMGDAIKNRATMLAPKLTGALKASGRVKETSEGVTVIFGGRDVRVPYAKRRHYENRKNPQTLRYLEKAGDSVAKENVKKYRNL